MDLYKLLFEVITTLSGDVFLANGKIPPILLSATGGSFCTASVSTYRSQRG